MIPPANPEDSGARRFVIEMIGFSDVEKSMFLSTFRLTSRRTYSYAEAENAGERADLYLANADNPDALPLLRQRAPNSYAPAVLIGRGKTEAMSVTEWPQVERPIHWMRLFEQMDAVMEEALLQRDLRKLGQKKMWNGQALRREGDQAESEPAHTAPIPTDSVLVVDDSATIRAFMRAKLAPFHFDVDCAETGEIALDMAQTKSYTCIFLDVMMPGIDGYQVCKNIKSNAATKDMAVVMLSSKSSTLDKMRGNWAGCDAYLGKPVTEDELLTTIARFLPNARKVGEAT
ncbi:MAG: response regulator [Burkholderiaceae bacterium]|nr:response regulator [Burkholderiaceae bacterium]